MKTEELEITDLLEDIVGDFIIVLHNDEVNTFDWVIECLVDICQHTTEQAEQCALFVHYKGKCTVMHGSFEKLGPICNDLCRRGLSATVEETKNA